MKNFRLFATVLMVALCAMVVTSCSDDDDDGTSGNTGKKVTKIVNEYDDEIFTEVFSYSNGKLSKHTAYYKDNRVENDIVITYNGNNVVIKGIIDNHEGELTYILSNGMATSCTYKDIAEGDDESFTFQYSDGYLIGMSCITPYGTEIYTFTHSNGNMTKEAQQGSWNGWNTFSYTNNLNKGGIFNGFIDCLSIHYLAFYAGILGKPTKNLVKSCTSGSDTSDFTATYTCVYSLDDDGYVKTAISSIDGKFTYTFE